MKASKRVGSSDRFAVGIFVSLTVALSLTLGSRIYASQGMGARHFPNVALVTHEGEEVRFYDDLIKGKVVAINFMYVKCKNF